MEMTNSQKERLIKLYNTEFKKRIKSAWVEGVSLKYFVEGYLTGETGKQKLEELGLGVEEVLTWAVDRYMEMDR